MSVASTLPLGPRDGPRRGSGPQPQPPRRARGCHGPLPGVEHALGRVAEPVFDRGPQRCLPYTVASCHCWRVVRL